MEDINQLVKVMQVVKIRMSENGDNDMFDEFKSKKL